MVHIHTVQLLCIYVYVIDRLIWLGYDGLPVAYLWRTKFVNG